MQTGGEREAASHTLRSGRESLQVGLRDPSLQMPALGTQYALRSKIVLKEQISILQWASLHVWKDAGFQENKWKQVHTLLFVIKFSSKEWSLKHKSLLSQFS